MTDTMRHRGPDGEGFLLVNGSEVKLCQSPEFPLINTTCALGHRRLSIIDKEGGFQPMCNENESVWITFNGAIYNHLELRRQLEAAGHIFRTHHSDTEVIIHAYEEWGVEGINSLNGIFAFGILDLTRKKLVLARDHFGVKPIYYYLKDGLFIFSSEIKAILVCDNVSRILDLLALGDFLTFRYVPSPRTTFQNIYKIEAGGYLEFSITQGQIVNIDTYNKKTIIIDYNKTFSEWKYQYQYCFEQAVKRQLLSDVEVGALLSGGIDSSAVCALASKYLGYPLRTYTVGFKDFPEANECNDASAFSKKIGSIHQNVVINETDFLKVLDEVAWFMDEPTATSSVIPLYYLTKEICREVKVVLTGQGADEPLAGYPRYFEERLYRAGFRYLRFVYPVVEALPRQEQLKRAFRSFMQENDFARFMNVYYLFDPMQKKALLKTPINEERNALLEKLFNQYRPNDNLGRMLYIDTRAWLPDDLLIYGDKASMINGIEARVPILDRNLVELIESMPSSLKLSWTLQGKYIHKKACEKWLPLDIIKRRKKGFATPIDKWFRNELSGYIKEQLLSGRICRQLFNESMVKNMVDKHQTGKEDHQRHLFALLMLEKWAERYSINI